MPNKQPKGMGKRDVRRRQADDDDDFVWWMKTPVQF